MNEQEIRTRLKNWIIERSDAADIQLNDQTEIIDDGLLTSLDVVELILFIEAMRDEEVEVDELEPESFANIDALIETFFCDVLVQ